MSLPLEDLLRVAQILSCLDACSETPAKQAALRVICEVLDPSQVPAEGD